MKYSLSWLTGSWGQDVFERRTSTGSEAFSLWIYLDPNKFQKRRCLNSLIIISLPNVRVNHCHLSNVLHFYYSYLFRPRDLLQCSEKSWEVRSDPCPYRRLGRVFHHLLHCSSEAHGKEALLSRGLKFHSQISAFFKSGIRNLLTR